MLTGWSGAFVEAPGIFGMPRTVHSEAHGSRPPTAGAFSRTDAQRTSAVGLLLVALILKQIVADRSLDLLWLRRFYVNSQLLVVLERLHSLGGAQRNHPDKRRKEKSKSAFHAINTVIDKKRDCVNRARDGAWRYRRRNKRRSF